MKKNEIERFINYFFYILYSFCILIDIGFIVIFFSSEIKNYEYLAMGFLFTVIFILILYLIRRFFLSIVRSKFNPYNTNK